MGVDRDSQWGFARGGVCCCVQFGLGPCGGWVTIWSRFPLEPLTTSDPVRTAAARIQHPTHSFIVYGTVLPWLGSTWRGYKSAGGEAFRQALEVQCADWVSLQGTHGDPILVAGDFNQDLSHTHYYGSNANRAALEEALDSVGLRPLTGYENDQFRRDSPRYACIDHICLSKDSQWVPVHALHGFKLFIINIKENARKITALTSHRNHSPPLSERSPSGESPRSLTTQKKRLE